MIVVKSIYSLLSCFLFGYRTISGSSRLHAWVHLHKKKLRKYFSSKISNFFENRQQICTEFKFGLRSMLDLINLCIPKQNSIKIASIEVDGSG